MLPPTPRQSTTRRRIHVAFQVGTLGVVFSLTACGLARGGQSIPEGEEGFLPGEDAGVVGPDVGIDAPLILPPDAEVGEDGQLVDPPPPPPPIVPGCEPTEEVCNGVDDDCNGEVDEVAPLPCPGGGDRYCVAGRFSECPSRCETCMPGTERVCFISYCTYWGVQTCAADGRAFSACREKDAPQVCRSVVNEDGNSPELEQCCLDNGYCCVDEFDLDGDGNKREMIGQCDEVECRN